MINDENEIIVLRIKWDFLSYIKQQLEANPNAKVVTYIKSTNATEAANFPFMTYLQVYDGLVDEGVLVRVERYIDRIIDENIANAKNSACLRFQFQVNKPKFIKLYKRIQSNYQKISPNHEGKHVFSCGKLKFNEKKSTLTFADRTIEISVKRQALKFLLILIKNYPLSVSKLFLCKELGFISKEKTERLYQTKTELTSEILPKLFPNNHKAISDMITSDTELGYKLVAPQK